MKLIWLRALKGHFTALEEASDEPGVNEARGYACEYVAWQFLTSLNDKDVIDFLLLELPPAPASSSPNGHDEQTAQENGRGAAPSNEQTPLLPASDTFLSEQWNENIAGARFGSLTSQCENLSALVRSLHRSADA